MAFLLKSSTTYDPILLLLNADDEEERDKLTNRWKSNKLAELNFIGIVGALLAGSLTSTGSWPSILPSGEASPWTVRTCWYSGILLSLLCVLTTAQQSIRLHRLAGHKHAERNIRRLLRQKKLGPNGQQLPRIAQVFTWQLSVVFLVGGVLCMVGGMFILMWSSTGISGLSFERSSWWNDEAKVAVTFTVVGVLAGLILIAEQFTLYSFAGEDDREGNDTSAPDDEGSIRGSTKSSSTKGQRTDGKESAS